MSKSISTVVDGMNVKGEIVQAQGLFALATERFEGPLVPALAYWQALAARYLTELCHTPQTAGPALEPIPPPTSAEPASLLLCIPSMPGAEYVTQGALAGLWNDLDALGDVLLAVAQLHPGCQVLVLCGHTHSGGELQVLENLRIVTGAAEYGKPKIQQIISVE